MQSMRAWKQITAPLVLSYQMEIKVRFILINIQVHTK
jgi:hypothetical protein